MVQSMVQFAEETALNSVELIEAATWQPAAFKAMMVGVSMAAAAIGLGLIGSNFMKALGRNPEAGKSATLVIAIAAMVEVTALLALGAAFIL